MYLPQTVNNYNTVKIGITKINSRHDAQAISAVKYKKYKADAKKWRSSSLLIKSVLLEGC